MGHIFVATHSPSIATLLTLSQHLVSVVTIAIATTMGVAIVSIATNKALLAIRIATRWSCSNTMQSQRNIGVAIVVVATQRKHCNRGSLLPRRLNGCYRWLRLLQRLFGLVATERSYIATFLNGCYRWHRLLPRYLGWLLQTGHLLPRY